MGAELLQGDVEDLVQGVATDSRLVKTRNIFFARIGEKLNGHKFLNAAIENSAAAVVVSKHQFCENDLQQLISNSVAVLSVRDPDEALAQLAKHVRSQFQFPVIAITGSNGKTTTKEMLRATLTKAVGSGFANEKSFNNHVGVPLTILSTPADSKWLVLEMGMNHPGELEFLSSIGQPDIVIILNVGPAHLGHFSSISEIADAKCELAMGLKTDGTLIIPDSDPEIFKALDRIDIKTKNIVYFGSELVEKELGTEQADFYASNIESLGFNGLKFKLSSRKQLFSPQQVEISQLGNHNSLNAMAALAASVAAFTEVDIEKFVVALSGSRGAAMRLESIERDKIVILNDCYNANPSSMRAAIEFSSSLEHPLILVLGHMGELGDRSEELHQEIGRIAANAQPDLLIAVGVEAEPILDGLGAYFKGEKYMLETEFVTARILEFLNQFTVEKTPKPVLLVKGSRSAGLERIVEELLEKID